MAMLRFVGGPISGEERETEATYDLVVRESKCDEYERFQTRPRPKPQVVDVTYRYTMRVFPMRAHGRPGDSLEEIRFMAPATMSDADVMRFLLARTR